MRKLSWMIAGATAGVAASVLAAPRPGWRTRRLIRRKAEHGCEYLDVARYDLMQAGSRACRRVTALFDEHPDPTRR